MCRLSASVGLKDVAFRRLLMHQTMLASNADNQRDGTGLSDGIVVAKSHKPFMEFGSHWIRWLNPNFPWLGHVRAASRGTRVSPYEAHPFRLPVGDRDLIAAHNGFVTGMPEPLRHEPMVDSYQAFKLLQACIQDSGGINAETINRWTSDFGPGSQWTFMFILDQTLHIARGTRDMYAMTVDGGWMFNTSSDVLLHVKEWANAYWGARYKIGRIFEIKPHKLVSIKPGDVELEFKDINPSPIEPNVLDKYYKWEHGADEQLLATD